MTKKNLLTASSVGLMVLTSLLTSLTGCAPAAPATTVAEAAPAATAPAPAVADEDDYDYYPAQEVYYSRNRHEYVYRDGGRWVRRSQPQGISINVLMALPSVHVDFRDAPERHHDVIVRSYPRNWKRPDNRHDDRDDKHNDRKDDRKKN